MNPALPTVRRRATDGEGWVKSSYSTTNGHCVEIRWLKSSYSATNGHCVEVHADERSVAVRDSKNPAGARLAFPASTWHTFLR